eukprot:7238158-Ditylum_brightwellii.AAC.1
MASITRSLDPPVILQSSQLVLSDWIYNAKKITMEVDGHWKLDCLNLDSGSWKFLSQKEK